MPSPHAQAALPDIFAVRQPVYTRNKDVFGHELLFQRASHARSPATNRDAVSPQAIMNMLTSIDMKHLTGNCRVFIRLPPEFIIDDESMPPMLHGQVVLELAEDTAVTPELIKGIERIRALGNMIALNAPVLSNTRNALLKHVDIIKIDIRHPGLTECPAERLKSLGVKLLADKIETHAQHQQALASGFDYFQGFFFSRPNIGQKRAQPANQLILLRILESLQNDDQPLAAIEHLIIQDAGLSYKLLRYINSAAYAQRRQIESIREALMRAGTATVKNWASLILMSRLSNDKPNELLNIALIRARMGETMARTLGMDAPSRMFTIGLFSTLDALLDTPMVELLETIELQADIKSALLERSGAMGELLTQIIAYQDADWDQLPPDRIDALWIAYMEALQWVQAIRVSAEG